VATPTTSSTTVATPTTSSTTVATPTTSSTTAPTPTTSTSSTTSSTAPAPTTSTSSTLQPTTSSSTSTSSTTSTTVATCCNNAMAVEFATVDAPGDCGDLIDAMGVLVTNIACSGLYTGGGGNSVPLPFAVPDQGLSVTSITSCTGQAATLGGTTSA